MSQQNLGDKINDYINSNPRESLFIAVILVSLFIQTVVALVGVILYVIYQRWLKWPWWGLLTVGALLTSFGLLLGEFQPNLKWIIHHAFLINKAYWVTLNQYGIYDSMRLLLKYAIPYVVCFSPLLAGVLSVINFIGKSPYNEAKDLLKKGKLQTKRAEVDARKVEKALSRVNDEVYADGTIIGVSKYSGKLVGIPDYFVNQVVLVLGTTGGGKSITLRRFYQRAIKKGYPLVVIDGKPTVESVEWLKNHAAKHGRVFYGFNCDEFWHYNCLASGGYTELKDKIISLKDRWENDYYRSVAEDYLQTSLKVLKKRGQVIDLRGVVKCLNYDTLQDMARETEDEALIQAVDELDQYARKDINGLKAHLNILIGSELGEYFDVTEKTFSLPQVMDESAVVYFALPALQFPSFSQVLGKLIINDLKSVIGRMGYDKKAFMVFDEFSVFAGEQVLNLVNMGRAKGVHAVFGTQGLADLERVSVSFKDQVLNCANTIICHRLNDQSSAEGVTSWIGTKDDMNLTAQIDTSQSEAQLGTVRWSKVFIVHPDDIKQGLQTGEAFYISKVSGFVQDKVRVKYS